MNKPITPAMHGAIDYATSAMVALAPRLMDFPRPARMMCDTLAGGYTALSATTDYPLGLKRVTPFRVHGGIELALAAALPAMPWLLGFADHKAARNLCFALTGLTLVVSALTDFEGE